MMTNDTSANPKPQSASENRATLTATPLRRIWLDLRNRFLEGLLVLLPVLITFGILWWLYSTLETYVLWPLGVLVFWKIRQLPGTPELPIWFEMYVAPLLGAVIALLIVYCCGAFGHARLRGMVDSFMLRVPGISHIYDGVRNVFKVFDQESGQQAPQRIVLVPFPHPGMRLPAIVTSSCRDVTTGKTVLCVYVPTTPVPASGFFLMLAEEDAVELNWDVQQTLQAIISGGLTAPAFVTFYKPGIAVVPGAPADPHPIAPSAGAGTS
jgi:uncharacterized membrane protein